MFEYIKQTNIIMDRLKKFKDFKKKEVNEQDTYEYNHLEEAMQNLAEKIHDEARKYDENTNEEHSAEGYITEVLEYVKESTNERIMKMMPKSE